MSNYRHGMTGSREYTIWAAMKARCSNPAVKAYVNYGARGITICSEWQTFSGFFASMGRCPDGYTIERVDNSKGYSPNNCIWASRKTQMQNKRDNVLININGVSKCLAEWAREYGVSYATAHRRIVMGWNPVDAVTMPKITRRKGIPRGTALHKFGSEHNVVWSDASQ